MIWDLDIRCFKSHYPSHNTFSKMQTQGSKDFSYSKEPKPKGLKSALPYDDIVESAKKESKKKRGSKDTNKNILGSKKSNP